MGKLVHVKAHIRDGHQVHAYTRGGGLYRSGSETKAQKYIKDIVKIHGNDYKKLSGVIVNNLVNANYSTPYKPTNKYIGEVWEALNKKFPS